VLQGIRLGIAGGERIELVVVDDGGDPAAAARLIPELERRGVVAVIGPLLSEGLMRAGQARSAADLVVISPTASDMPLRAANVYSLNAGDLEGARSLARYAAGRGLRQVALLYPGNPDFRATAVAFRDALLEAGGRVTVDVGYMDGTTTFAEQMRRIRDSGAQAVYIAASERDVRQIAPQIEYYGLGDMQILGSEAWTSDEVLRSMAPRLLEGVIAATPMLPTSGDIGWNDFVGRYEAAHRRTLDNPYPALGFDAMRLIVQALQGGRNQSADVARGLAAMREYRGATGILSTQNGELVRRPFIVRIQGGRPVPIGAAD
jgi:branched-chain amino acid transport system substrate-binding protein